MASMFSAGFVLANCGFSRDHAVGGRSGEDDSIRSKLFLANRLIPLLLLATLVLGGCTTAGTPFDQANLAAPPESATNFVVKGQTTVEVPFVATLAAFNAQAKDPSLRKVEVWFEDKWDPATTYGKATVVVPLERQPGDAAGQRIRIDPGRNIIEWEDRFKASLLRIVETSRVEAARFSRIASGGARGDVVVLVHGYNTRPEEAIYRAAQLKVDTGYERPVIAFLWPVDYGDGFRGYVAAKNGVMASQAQLIDVLKRLAADENIDRIHILAHSMGALLTVQALSEYARENRSKAEMKIAEVVFAAPALPDLVYESRLQALRSTISRGLTVYASKYDRPLALGSKYLDRQQLIGRIADNPGFPILIRGDFAEFVDASAGIPLSDIWSRVLRHSIFLEDQGLRKDIANIFRLPATEPRRNPSIRDGSSFVPKPRTGGSDYWVYEPGRRGS